MSSIGNQASAIRNMTRFQLVALPSGDLSVAVNFPWTVINEQKLEVIFSYDHQSAVANPDDYLLVWEFIVPNSILFSRQNTNGDMRISGTIKEYL